jgi:hypothetical protein
VPRILDLMDKHRVKLSSFMIGQAVEEAPDLAREIVRRGHEAAAHGRTWQKEALYDVFATFRYAGQPAYPGRPAIKSWSVRRWPKASIP